MESREKGRVHDAAATRRPWRTAIPVALVVLTTLVAFSAAQAVGAGRLALSETTSTPHTTTRAAGLSAVQISIGPGLGIQVSKYLFGANLLWADGAEGAFDPLTGRFHPGFVAALRDLGITMLRYPGGTTSDSFQWQIAVGRQEARGLNEPYGMQAARLSSVCCVLDGPERSAVGPDEFGSLLEETGAAGTVTVNFDTGSESQAADFVAYMTSPLTEHPSPNPNEASYWAALRAINGHPAPYDIPYWEVGNEQAFPGQYGWRSGRPLKLGPHRVPCPAGEMATCLYAFGGTTRFTDEGVGTLADDLPAASYSTGAPHQRFYVYFPPVVPGSEAVYVGGSRWREVPSLVEAGPGARVYTLDVATGAITFGDGRHGMIPPEDALVKASYDSGPHGGFVEFYRAMKAMNSRISVCESEEADVAFIRLMGKQYPYDCVELHEYARPADFAAPLAKYEDGLMAFPVREGAALAWLQNQIRRYSGRRIPVLMTEYGQLVAPVPVADPAFNLSLDEGLLTGAQLITWIDHQVPVAERYLAESAPLIEIDLTSALRPEGSRQGGALSASRGGRAAYGSASERALSIARIMVETGLSPDSGAIALLGRSFVVEPSGLALSLMSQLAGRYRLAVWIRHDPQTARGAPALWATATAGPSGGTELVVINASPDRPVLAEIVLRRHVYRGWLRAEQLDGPSPTAYNTPSSPKTVHITSCEVRVSGSSVGWKFPAHSLTLLVLPGLHPFYAHPRHSRAAV
ncbi:MAG TPA: hypothetical protein VED59_06630 [Acidimicrobiales bacterium]|nr:hypothetical protein [Acidimicrobiales bacterium]